jgi:hypothetical protein
MACEQGEYLLSKARIILWIVLLLFLVYDIRHFSTKVSDVNRLAGMDYFGYWSCGRVFLAGGNCYKEESVYPVQHNQGRLEKDTLISWNPPWMYVLMLPFLALPFMLGRILWFMLTGLALAWAADYFWISYGGSIRVRYISWLSILFFVPSAVSLNLGQITPLLLVGIAGFLWFTRRRQDWLAGISLLIMSIKPQVIWLFAFFLVLWIWQERRWKILAGAVASLAVIIVISLLINPSSYSFYLNEIRAGYGPHIWETPVPTTALRMLFPEHEVLLRYFLPIVGLIIGSLLWVRWRKHFDWQQHLTPILIISVLTSPYGFTHDLIVLLPLALEMVILFQKERYRQLPYIIGLAAVQIASALLIFTARRSIVLVWLAPALALLYWISRRSASGKESRSDDSNDLLTT